MRVGAELGWEMAWEVVCCLWSNCKMTNKLLGKLRSTEIAIAM